MNAMKKFWKYLAACCVAATLTPLLAACDDDDDEVDPYDINYCYLYQPNSTYAQLEYKANGQFIIDINDPLKLMPVRLTKPAPRAITVKVAIDPSLVDEYNAANSTNYVFLQGASITNPVLQIPAGGYISPEAIEVTFGDHSGFQTGDPDLILPVVITDADGLTISKSSRIFLTFTSTYRANIITPKTGARVAVDRDVAGWETAYASATIDNFLTTTWAADDPVVINASIDPTLVDAYNAANATNYQAIQASLTSSQLNIAAGQSAVSLGLTLGDYTGVANAAKYLIPVKLAVASGRGAELSADVAYIEVIDMPPTLTASTSEPAGYTQIAWESSWTGIANTPYGDEDFGSTILESAGSWYYVETGYVMTVDLASVKAIDMLAFQFYAWYYALNDVRSLQFSADGNNWTDCGDLALGRSATWYIELSKPVSARYVRWIAGDYSYSSNYGCFYRQVRFYSK